MAEKKTTSGEIDSLVLESIYPDAVAIFSFQPAPLKAVMSDCLIVLDTNVLLVPYGTGQESLVEVRRTYTVLANQRRLIVPGRVAREFAKNRSEKLKAVFRQVALKRNISLKRETYPLLESLSEYQEVIRLEQEIDSQLRTYRDAVGRLSDAISSWYWNDPVSTLYRELFSADVIHEPEIDKDVLLTDLERRQSNKIPPGYKDAGKEDGGIGDLVIWNTILDLGRSRNAHVVFVSGDEKADWWHQSDNRALFPRFELVDEFRRTSGGKSFYIISFAKLLELLGASSEVVQEVRQEEAAVNLEETSRAVHAAFMARALMAERAVFRWLSKKYPAGDVVLGSDMGADFMINSKEGSTAFKVRYVQRARVDIRFLESRLAYSFRPDLARVYVVFVCDDQETIDKVIRFVSRRPLSPRIGRIFGFLTYEGEFQPVLGQEPHEEAEAGE